MVIHVSYHLNRETAFCIFFFLERNGGFEIGLKLFKSKGSSVFFKWGQTIAFLKRNTATNNGATKQGKVNDGKNIRSCLEYLLKKSGGDDV